MTDYHDKRSIFTDALETLGTIIGNSEKRDAIHLAVEPVIAGEYSLLPGEHVGVWKNADGVLVAGYGDSLGIVDPFLREPVKPHERFWLIVYPRKITSLRHVWTHPDFDDVEDLVTIDYANYRASEKWIRDYAISINVGYDEIMDFTRVYVADESKYPDYWSQGDRFEGTSLPYEFWIHYENVTQTKVPENRKESFFSCAC